MKKIIFIILIAFTLNAQSLFEGKAGDVWHLTGSTIGTLAIQKTFHLQWYQSAYIMFGFGCAWEICDDAIGKHPFDKRGFDQRDLLYDLIGILISYPLKYDIKLSKNKISLGIRF